METPLRVTFQGGETSDALDSFVREHVESLFEAARLGVASMQEWLQEHGDVRRTA